MLGYIKQNFEHNFPFVVFIFDKHGKEDQRWAQCTHSPYQIKRNDFSSSQGNYKYVTFSLAKLILICTNIHNQTLRPYVYPAFKNPLPLSNPMSV